MNREPKVRAYQARPRRTAPSADSAVTEAIVIGGMIAFLFLIYLMADLVRQLPG
jgi:hypothetical protein